MSEQIDSIIIDLTGPQRRAIFPGPGNPGYARGDIVTMHELRRIGIVVPFPTSLKGDIAVELTRLGQQVRERLHELTAARETG